MFRPLFLFSLAFIGVWTSDKPAAPAAKKADRIVVEKSTRTMKLMLDGRDVFFYLVRNDTRGLSDYCGYCLTLVTRVPVKRTNTVFDGGWP
jgi:hypothetical protein